MFKFNNSSHILLLKCCMKVLAQKECMTSSRKSIHVNNSTLAAVVFIVHQRACLPYGNHPLPIFVLLFININVSSCHILDGCDIAASPTHDPRHNRGWYRQFLWSSKERAKVHYLCLWTTDNSSPCTKTKPQYPSYSNITWWSQSVQQQYEF